MLDQLANISNEQIARQLANATLIMAGYGLADLTLTLGRLVLP